MKRLMIFIISVTICTCSIANNLQLGTPVISDPTHISFTIQWDNSWKVSTGPANWDAVWVFVKYQNCPAASQPWQHVVLSATSTDHTVTGTILQIDAVPDGMGVFIHRAAAGSGSITSSTVTLKMTITDAGNNYQLNGIEMVYIPGGNQFYVGDGNLGGGSFFGFCSDGSFDPVTINSSVQNTTGLTAAQYVNQNVTYRSSAPLPTTFPFGYNAFYCMKYEISQVVYAAFLNTLTYTQQATRFANLPNSAAGTFALALSPNICRNGIRIQTPGVATTVPAVVGCDLDLDGIPNEADDGTNIACNWLSWSDMTAFLCWAALRPMTEFEYEKVCRGTAATLTNEYVWGTNVILAANSGSINNPGLVNETSISSGPGLCAYNANTNINRGPLRCGFGATSTTNRAGAGSTFYGVMEMGGNVMEQCIGGNNGYNYSTFTSAPGDGNLTAAGNSDILTWPANGGGNVGGILRGGDWYDVQTQYCQTSNRDFMNSNVNQNNRDYRIGGRGVR